MKLIIFPLLFLTSCSHLFNYLDKDPNVEILPEPPIQSYCNQTKQDVFLSKNKKAQTLFKSWIDNVPNLQFIDKVVLWSLFQINVRPDYVIPEARLQTVIKLHGHTYYFDFNNFNLGNGNVRQTYMAGLDYLLRRFNSSHGLSRLSRMLDSWSLTKVPINESLSKFIERNKLQMADVSVLDKTYFKAGEPLLAGESIPKLNYSHLYSSFQRNPKGGFRDVSTKLYPFTVETKNPRVTVKCSSNMQLYSDSVFNIAPENSSNNTAFAYYDSAGNSFGAIVSTIRKGKLVPTQEFLINGENGPWPGTICVVQNDEYNSVQMLMSIAGRDPGQHLHHLIQYEIFNSKKISNVGEYIRFPRYEFLVNPVRMLYESGRGTTDQLETFLQMDFPIYHSTKLGEVWAFAHFKNEGEWSWITDDREESYFTCQNVKK